MATGALALEWSSVVGDGALHREATVAAKDEGHGGLAEWHIVGEGTIKPQVGAVSRPILISLGRPFTSR